MFGEYTKIEIPFERDIDGSKKLLEGTWRNETVEYLKDNSWHCTEKIDGTNIGVAWDGHRVLFQGRQETAQIPAKLINKLNELFGGNENEELFEQKFGEMQIILFGEGYGATIQKGGGNYRQDVSFILFDAYLPERNLWLKRDAVEDIAKAFNIDCVPIVLKGTIQEAIDYVKTSPASTIGTAKMEGLVCKPEAEMLDRRGKRAGYVRNADMAKYSVSDGNIGMLLAFWDGKSKGTKHMIDLANKYGLNVHIVNS